MTLHRLPTRSLFLIGQLLMLLVASRLAVAAEVTARAVPAEGQPFAAKLIAVDAAWNITLGSGEEKQTLAAADLVQWGGFRETRRGTLILLAGGDMLVADVLKLDGEHLLVDSLLLGEVKLPLERLVGIVFKPSVDRRAADRAVARVRSAKGETDAAVLTNGDRLQGTLGEIAGDKATLQTATGKLTFGLNKIRSISFNPALVELPKTSGKRAVVGLSDGSHLTAAALTLGAGDATLKLLVGPSVEAAAKDIVALQPLGGRAVYLSDLKPAAYKHIPYLKLTWPYQADGNVTGSRLRAAGQLYLKGLGMHSAAQLTYRLNGTYKRFAAEVAIDDASGDRGSVNFRVYIHDGKSWKVKYTSPVVRGGDAPLSVSVDLTGAKAVSLLVDYADRGDELDHADWLNARLIK
ncbi:MAG: NPCBM/NEW2 domain-containing protein [Planctomycetes bacterium]|nr:NPCBM/NEW2 domain-containing protein [Planctomycetota bacterium]